MDEDFIKGVDVEKIAREGQSYYDQIKDQYDPLYKGEILAIDPDSKDVFLGKTGADALMAAKKKYPHKIFYVVRIGYDVVETIAQLMEQ